MITDQSVIRDLPGAYDVAVCGEDRIPLSNFATMATRTLFDAAIQVDLEIHTAGPITGIVGRDGAYARMFQHSRQVEPGMKVTLTAGTAQERPYLR